MTPTEQNEKLRKSFKRIATSLFEGGKGTGSGEFGTLVKDPVETATNSLYELYDSYSHKKLLEGKIEELKAFKDRMWSEVTVTSSDANYPNAMHFRLNDRIEKLTQELEGNK